MSGKRARRVSLGVKDLPVAPITSLKSPQTPNWTEKEIFTHPDNRPYCSITMFGETKTGLLDSGSAVTLKAICPLIAKMRRNITSSPISLTAANELPIKVIGMLLVPYKFGDSRIEHQTIIVQQLSEDLILGYDFFMAAGLKINRSICTIATQPLDIKCEQPLSGGERKLLHDIVSSFPRTENGIIGRTNVLEHDIELIEGAKPFTCKPYFFSPEMEKKINEEVDEMLEKGIIGPSHSSVCSPLVPVRKPDGAIRVCLDSRKLNQITVKDKYPIPNIPHMMARIQKLKYISSIDLNKAFWQIPLCQRRQPGQFASAQQLTAFIVPGRGLFEYKVMPFGLCNGPATQCRLMDQVLKHDLSKNVFVYVDDILIITETKYHMLELLAEVASRLRLAKLTINVKKSIFFAKSVKYVGYVLSEKGIGPDPEKLTVVEKYPKPKTIKEVRRFLGMSGYYRRLIQNYSELAAPLTDLLKKTAGKMVWTEVHEKAFENLKKAMTTAPVVATPDFDLEFQLQCDASDIAAGAALGQVQNGEEVVIAYFSHKWANNEKNWAATEKEAAAVLLAIKHFRNYIWGRKFTVITDAQALTHIKTIHADGAKRLARWVMELNSYEMEIKHRAGRLSVVPDALSRAVNCIRSQENEVDEFQRHLIAQIEANPDNYPDYRVVNGVIKRLEKVKDDIGCMSHRWKEYVPVSRREEVIKKVHKKLMHLGVKRSMDMIRRAYFWPNLRKSVQQVIRKCEACKSAKVRMPFTRMPLGGARKAKMPFEMISIDHWGPATRSKRRNKYLLVIVDIFSKYVILEPCQDTKAEKVIQILETKVFLQFNPPKILISDNFRPLVGMEMGEFLRRYSVEHWTIPYYHSQANPTERYIRTASTAIRAFVHECGGDQTEWDALIPRLQWAINTTPSETTGKSAFFINFGREPLNEGEEVESLEIEYSRRGMSIEELRRKFREMREKVHENTQRAQSKYKSNYDEKVNERHFLENEKVRVRNHALSCASEHISRKLLPTTLPGRITKKLGPETYEVTLNDGRILAKIHANQIITD